MKILMITVVLFLLFLLSIYCINIGSENAFSEENYIRPMSGEPDVTFGLLSDKEVYKSSEEMELNATIQTGVINEDLTIRIYGIQDKRGNYRVNAERTVRPESPIVKETFSFKMPSCYGCAGVSPEDYEIVMEIVKNDTVIGNFSETVTLEK